jgi:adenylate cyclase class IV
MAETKELEAKVRDLEEANEILKQASLSSRGSSTVATVDL